jgi:hypothetical protein
MKAFFYKAGFLLILPMLAAQLAVVLHYPAHLPEVPAAADHCPIVFAGKALAGAVTPPTIPLQTQGIVRLRSPVVIVFTLSTPPKPFHSQGPPVLS